MIVSIKKRLKIPEILFEVININRKLKFLKLLLILGIIFLIIITIKIFIGNNIGINITKNSQQFNIPNNSPTNLPINNGSDTILTRENIYEFSSLEYLKKYMYSSAADTYFTYEDLDVSKLMRIDLSVDLNSDKPKILVFHTHSKEFYNSGVETRKNSIVGIGDELCRVLEEAYGIKTIHDDGEYDTVNGARRIDGAYERMASNIQKILDENPSIEICIDLHRDILPSNAHLLWYNNKVPTAKIMFFNGLSRIYKDGLVTELTDLPNVNQKENLAFSMQMKLISNEKYPEFTRKNFLRAYRYSLHMKGKSLLIEIGSDQNSAEEAYNAVKPLAEILVECIRNR